MCLPKQLPPRVVWNRIYKTGGVDLARFMHAVANRNDFTYVSRQLHRVMGGQGRHGRTVLIPWACWTAFVALVRYARSNIFDFFATQRSDELRMEIAVVRRLLCAIAVGHSTHCNSFTCACAVLWESPDRG